MTTNFELMTRTSRKEDKWVHSLSIYEKNLLSYDVSCTDQNENTVTRLVLEEFVDNYPKMRFLLTKIKTCLGNDRRKFLETNEPVFSIVEESEVNPDLLRKHISCWERWEKKVGPFTRNFTKLNGIHRISVKNMLKYSKENRPAMNFFTQNSCPVCMASYKEVIEEDHHIVIPACGHPICCKCCDELLRNDGRCSICRDDYDIEEFDIMVFDINLQQIPHKGNVFH